jgi:thymidylate synthase (FAD)
MKIIAEPRVEVISAPMFLGAFVPPIPRDGDGPTRLGSFTAKVCYRSFGESRRSNEANQRAIIASGHGRILEHINFGLFITGISRALGNELITHKAGVTVSQESTRYVDMKESGVVLEPYMAELGTESYQVGEFLDQCRRSFETYEYLVSQFEKDNPLALDGTDLRKWARGKARNVLPLALETSIVMTANLRAWRHFIETRSDPAAEAEIRRLTKHIFEALQPWAPLYFEDYTPVEVMGFPHYQTPNRKV